MEFREIGWANLVFISVLDRPRSIEEISDEWDVESYRVESHMARHDLKRLTRNRLLRGKEGEKYFAALSSQPFVTELRNYLKTNYDSVADGVEDRMEDFVELIQRDGFRENVLSIDVVRDFYNDDFREAKENPLDLFYVVMLVLDDDIDSVREIDIEHDAQPVMEAIRKYRETASNS
ncbi:MAG: hypothetical protein ABEK01_04850 [Candidatus Nanohaloarchaea archaeon]